jgi:MerR family redox-sensitive transcriptional activator SoxR
MADITIGEAAKRVGLAASALRFYEQAGVLPPARRINGRRVYDEGLLDLIEVARFAQGVGFSLAEVRALFHGNPGKRRLGSQWKPLARAKLKELDAIISRARQMKGAIELGLECGCIRVEDCLPAKRGGAQRSRSKPGRPASAPRGKSSPRVGRARA